MLSTRIMMVLFLVMVLASASLSVWAQQPASYSVHEMDEIISPIALYPDPLIAQILPAATFFDQLNDAAQLVNNGGSYMIDQQNWDVSVKAVAHYPAALNMMVGKPDWTVALGQAYINQAGDVMKSIQRLRLKASMLGYLRSTPQEKVIDDGGYFRIVPAQPGVIYVPTYDPAVVYVQPRPSYGTDAIIFGVGLVIGAWLNRDCDWHGNRVFYHGWHGEGWIAQSRSFVSINNTTYVNNIYSKNRIAVNREIMRRDVGGFRADVRAHAGTFTSFHNAGGQRPVRNTPGGFAPAGKIPGGRISGDRKPAGKIPVSNRTGISRTPVSTNRLAQPGRSGSSTVNRTAKPSSLFSGQSAKHSQSFGSGKTKPKSPSGRQFTTPKTAGNSRTSSFSGNQSKSSGSAFGKGSGVTPRSSSGPRGSSTNSSRPSHRSNSDDKDRKN